MVEGLADELSGYEYGPYYMGSFLATSRGLGHLNKSSFESNLIRWICSFVSILVVWLFSFRFNPRFKQKNKFIWSDSIWNLTCSKIQGHDSLPKMNPYIDWIPRSQVLLEATNFEFQGVFRGFRARRIWWTQNLGWFPWEFRSLH